MQPKLNVQTILLVDDDEIVRKALHNYLERCGYNLLEAEDGEEALLIARLHEGPIDFLITDIVMPKLGGFELAKFVREIRPGVRCIYISGYPEEALRVARLGDRPSFLAKPFHPRDLLTILQNTQATEMARTA